MGKQMERSVEAAARFRGIRRAHRDETGEDYVEAIAQLGEGLEARGQGIGTTGSRGARVRDLARMMGVTHVTVVRIVKRLAGEGLVTTERGKPIVLTPAGVRLAARARERHEVVLGFLRAIGVPLKQAEIDAEGIEHHVSEATISAMRRVARKGGRG